MTDRLPETLPLTKYERLNLADVAASVLARPDLYEPTETENAKLMIAWEATVAALEAELQSRPSLSSSPATPDVQKRLTEIRGRVEKATPGPWKAKEETSEGSIYITQLRAPGTPAPCVAEILAPFNSFAVEDAALIANAPTDLRFLLDELERRSVSPSEAQNAKLKMLAGFFVSVIKSGESWSSECERMYDEAFLPVSPETPATNIEQRIARHEIHELERWTKLLADLEIYVETAKSHSDEFDSWRSYTLHEIGALRADTARIDWLESHLADAAKLFRRRWTMARLDSLREAIDASRGSDTESPPENATAT